MKLACVILFIIIGCKVFGQGQPNIVSMLNLCFDDVRFDSFYSKRIVYVTQSEFFPFESLIKSGKRTIKVKAVKHISRLRDYISLTDFTFVRNLPHGRMQIVNRKGLHYNVSFIKVKGIWEIRESELMSDD